MDTNNGNLTFEERINYIMDHLSVEQKISLLMHESPEIKELGIKRYNWWNEALHGVARAGCATVFPQSIGLAATFNDTKIEEVSDVISTEGRAKYNEFAKLDDTNIYKGLTFWSPNINIFRDPRWGRGQETYGEDPELTARIGTAFIRGIQGNDPKYLKAIATPKHFYSHSGPEHNRHSFDATPSKHDIYNTYTYAFRRCFNDAKAKSVMTAYNRVNGELCVGSSVVIQDLLRDELGFDGVVVSDCGSVRDTFEFHKVVDELSDAAALSIKAGLDLECGNTYFHLYEALQDGKITEGDIDKSLYRVLQARFELGLFDENIDQPYDHLTYDDVATSSSLKLAKEVAAETFVLLKNDGILPLATKKITLIGPNIHNDTALIGNYAGTPAKYETILNAFSNDPNYEIRFAEGSHLYHDNLYGCGYEGDSFSEAIIFAKNSEVVIMGVGLTAELEGEDGDAYNPINHSGDRMNIKLPKVQVELIKKIASVNKNIILINFSGSCIAFDDVEPHVKAILQVWYPGGEGGLAIKEVLEGKLKPSGRLPVTFYSKENTLPDIEDYSMANRTYKYFEGEPYYRFGFGLSYGDIKFENCQIVNNAINIDITSNELTPIQVYIKSENGLYLQKLVDFTKVEMNGQASITLPIKDQWFMYYNDNGHEEFETGNFEIIVTSRNDPKASDYTTFSYYRN